MGLLDLLRLRSPSKSLFIAARFADLSLAEKAIRRGANPAAEETTERQTPLHIALRYSAPSSTAAGVAQRPPLHVRQNILDVTKLVRILLDAGAPADAVDVDKVTPLHWASGKGMYEAARILIDAGADINARDSSLYTPLHNAALGGWSDSARVLLEAGAEVNAKHSHGQTPLMIVPTVVPSSGPDPMAQIRSLLREYGGQ